jgi:hypothetical protein
MKRHLLLIVCLTVGGCGSDSAPAGPSGASGPTMSFFVTSATSVTGNLAGLAGADMTCQRLAAAAGQFGRTWRAYLSVERDPANGNQPTHARDRIGTGPWYNAALVLVANNVAELHARPGDAALFLDERGRRINGQWTGSPGPNEHDIMTGSNQDGTLAVGLTCRDWRRSPRTPSDRWDIPTGWGRTRVRPVRCRPGTRRTPTRTARTRRRAGAPDASIVLLGESRRSWPT